MLRTLTRFRGIKLTHKLKLNYRELMVSAKGLELLVPSENEISFIKKAYGLAIPSVIEANHCIYQFMNDQLPLFSTNAHSGLHYVTITGIGISLMIILGESNGLGIVCVSLYLVLFSIAIVLIYYATKYMFTKICDELVARVDLFPDRYEFLLSNVKNICV